jgi:Flp pilus assembly protein TadB
MKKNRYKGMEKEFGREIQALQSLKAEENVPVPDISEIRSLVQDVTEKEERASRLSFMLFACLAAALLVGMCVAILAFKSLFVMIQLASLLPLPFVAILYGRRVRKNG